MRLATSCHAGREGGRRLFLVMAVVLVPVFAGAADVLFPQPLHLTRRIEDGLTGTVTVVEEYCEGSRMVSAQSGRVVIADYDKQTITEIDRSSGTYSVARFDEIARTLPATASRALSAVATAKPVGTHQGASGRMLEGLEVSSTTARFQIGVDRSVNLPEAAVDVLMGTAYPSFASPEQGSLRAAVATGLPAEQITTFHADGREVVVRNVVTRIGSERAPPELCSIPAGARRVESRYAALSRMAAELDQR